MAPSKSSSAASKKKAAVRMAVRRASTKTAKKGLPPTSSSSSSTLMLNNKKPTVVVRRGAATGGNKKGKKGGDASKKDAAAVAAVIPTLPSSWPVATRPPSLPPDASALPPGSLLQDKCSGHDVHLARSAVAVPNVMKEKGKFLLLFPGNFSFHKAVVQQMQQQQEPSSSQKSKEEENDSDNEGNDEDGDDNANGESKPAAQTTTTTPSKAPPPSLGRLVGLGTDAPSFCIPFPPPSSHNNNNNQKKQQQQQQQRMLVFAGKKVPTSSKYILLSCANKQKMAVQCKAIFSSAIVFDTPKWQDVDVGTFNDGEDFSDNNNVTTMADEEAAAVKQSSKVAHYGGSYRTVDGMARGHKKRPDMLVTAAVAAADRQSVIIPIISQQPPPTEDAPGSIFGFPGRGGEQKQNGISAAPTTGSSSIRKKPASIAMTPIPTYNLDTTSNEGDDSDSEASFRVCIPSGQPRHIPKRQASLKRKRYTADDDDEEESSDGDNEGSEVKEVPPSPPTKRSKSTQRPATKTSNGPDNKKTQPSTNGIAKKSSESLLANNRRAGNQNAVSKMTGKGNVSNDRGTAKHTPLELSSDGDSSFDIKPRASMGRVTKRAQQMIGQNDEAYNRDKTTAKRSGGKVTTNRNLRRKRTSTQQIRLSLSSEESEGSVAGNHEVREKTVENGGEKEGPKGKQARLKASIGGHEAEKTVSSRKAQRRTTAGAENNDMPRSITQSQSPSSKSPFRRRKKKESLVGPPAATKALDLTENDDEFAFG